MSSIETSENITTIPKEKRRSFFANIIRRLIVEKPLGTFGGIIVLVLFLTGIFCNFLAPYSYVDAYPSDSLSPPSAQYLLGTDSLGRDMLSRLIYGARVSMIVGISASVLSLLVAILIGLPSGLFGGRYDMFLQRFIDAWLCVPPLFIVLVVMTFVGQGMTQVIFVIGLVGGVQSSRVVRSAVIGIKGNVYIEASRAIGSTSSRLLIRHILPNVAAPLIIIFSLQLGTSILMEATISFLGFGIPPPAPSWGGMLTGTARQYMYQAPWLVMWPGLALAVVVYGINMLGDALRDVLDPRLRGGAGRYGLTKRITGGKKFLR